jgi:hypothetical protein
MPLLLSSDISSQNCHRCVLSYVDCGSDVGDVPKVDVNICGDAPSCMQHWCSYQLTTYVGADTRQIVG